jgi:hypothetical protein
MQAERRYFGYFGLGGPQYELHETALQPIRKNWNKVPRTVEIVRNGRGHLCRMSTGPFHFEGQTRLGHCPPHSRVSFR